jgi:hypothetical protein
VASSDDPTTTVPEQPALPAGGPPSGREVVRRMIVAAVVLVAIGLLVLAAMLSDSAHDDDVTVSGGVVERLIPGENQETLRQTPVGLDLAPGWGVSRLSINGVDTREDEWDITPELGLYQYLPASGKTVESLQADQNCVSATIFQLADLAETRVVNWCFTAA